MQNMMMNGMPMWYFGPVMWLIFIVLVIVPFWFIFQKAGYSKWLSILMVVPIVNIIMLFFLAFSTWPALSGKEK